SRTLFRPVSSLFPYTTLFRSDKFSSMPVQRISPNNRAPVFFCRCHSLTVSLTYFCVLFAAYPTIRALVNGSVGLPCNISQTKERSEEHTSELQSRFDLVCRLL